MTEEATEFPPPRELRGRRARKIWREIAPVASATGRLNAASRPFLLLLCRELARMYDEEDGADVDVRHVRDLARSFGVLK